MGDAFWDRLMEVKTAVNKELEKQRNEKVIGAALSAEVTLYCDEDLSKTLARLGDELRFAMMVSQVQILPLSEAANAAATEVKGLQLSIKPSKDTKCVRCWHYRPDIGIHSEHPELCARCVENITGAGEKRLYA